MNADAASRLGYSSGSLEGTGDIATTGETPRGLVRVPHPLGARKRFTGR